MPLGDPGKGLVDRAKNVQSRLRLEQYSSHGVTLDGSGWECLRLLIIRPCECKVLALY
jgi:hypothetical protein